MGTAKLPRVENVFGLFGRKIFVAYGFWNVDTADESEPSAMFLEREEKPPRQLAQVVFALNHVDIHLLSGVQHSSRIDAELLSTPSIFTAARHVPITITGLSFSSANNSRS
jgi:hypothetical protein